jgi:hypothetical protein
MIGLEIEINLIMILIKVIQMDLSENASRCTSTVGGLGDHSATTFELLRKIVARWSCYFGNILLVRL